MASWGMTELYEQMREAKEKQKQQWEELCASITVYQESKWLAFWGSFKNIFFKMPTFSQAEDQPQVLQ